MNIILDHIIDALYNLYTFSIKKYMELNNLFSNIALSINPEIDYLIDKSNRKEWLFSAHKEWIKDTQDIQLIDNLITLLNTYIETFTNEKWKSLADIGFDNYQISTNGRIQNTKTNKILKCGIDDDGYIRVALSINNKPKFKMVHVLVAQSFIENTENKPTVDHIDRCKYNNNINNLRWATYTEQNYNRGTPKYKNVGRSIVQSLTNGDIIKIWDSAAQIQRELGIDSRRIIDACRNVRNSTQYNWNYIEEFNQNPDEIWKEIPYPELKGYFASSNGRIMKSNGRIYKGSIKKGYNRIVVRVNGNNKEYRVHRLIATAFYGIHDNLVVNHVNGNKSDNNISNLEFTTTQENNIHAYKIGSHHRYSKEQKYCPILQLDLKNNIIAEYKNSYFAHLATGAIQGKIIKVCKGNNKTAGGYRWCYKI